MIGGLYEVTGRRQFRGHPLGATFAAVLDPLAEQRAIGRGDIRLIKRITPQLQPGSYTLPPGWLNQEQEARHEQ